MNKCEILRLLGAKPDAALEKRIEQTVLRSRPRAFFRVFPLVRNEKGLFIGGAPLPGRDAAKLLSGCDRAIMLAATLGAETDADIAAAAVRDISASVIADACASSMIEEYCDARQAELEREYGWLTDRFSPGYGDLPLDMQRDFARLLDMERKIGVRVTDSLLLSPRKSVTAIIGIAREPQKKRPRCEGCKMTSCPARR